MSIYISNDLNKKRFVINGIEGYKTIDDIIRNIDRTLTKKGCTNFQDLLDILRRNCGLNSYKSKVFEDYILANTNSWIGHREITNSINAPITLYILYSIKAKFNNSSNVTPDISSIKTYNDRAVLVQFADGTFTKAVAMDKDPFDFDMLFTIAYLKRMLGEDGHKKYHKLIDKAHKILNNQEKAKIKDINDKEKLQAKKKKMLDKNNKKSKEAGDRISKLIHDAVLSAFADSVKPTYIPNTEDDLK